MDDAKILCVHPNFELYGSDRWFADALVAMEQAFGRDSLRALLPRPGPIETLAPFDHVETQHRPMLIVRRKGFLRRALGTALGAPKLLWLALRDMNAAQGTYINTIIAMDFLLMARFSRRPVVIHVHEIPPERELKIFRAFVIFANRPVIFNSEASRKAFALPERFSTSVVYNGFKDPGEPARTWYETGKKLRVLVIGRINRWKGQEVLVDACAMLPDEIRQELDVRIVGDVFEGLDELRQSLTDRIAAAGLTDTISMHSFEDDPSSSYIGADVVVVPSRLPEPFGRVAIEAMAYGCCVVASNHGGLTEIVVDGETGTLFAPGDAPELAKAITDLVKNPDRVVRYGRQGRARFVSTFTQAAIDRAFVAAVEPILRQGTNSGTVRAISTGENK